MTAFTFFKPIKKALSFIVSASLVLTTTFSGVARAQTFPCSAYAADTGTDARCAAVRVGGVPVPYPKLSWEFVSDMATAPAPGSSVVQGGSESVAMANRAALSLGLKASDIANAATVFPANVPYIFARYNPGDASLMIDIFKLEKTTVGGLTKAGLYHSTFTPSHGDLWKANRAYISPDAFKSGMTPGVNPFSSFLSPGSDAFANISLAGAQVAIGHAMRVAGAPLALLSVADSRMSTETHKSGGLFTKKVDTYVFGHAKPKWFIAQPTDILQRSTTPAFASFCAADPNRDNCERFATAVSGVGFEEFDGGTLSALEDKWQIDHQRSSGLSFLGALVLAVVGSFALAGILAAAGTAGAIGAGTVGAAGAGAAGATTAMGTFGSFLVSQGAITGFTTLASSIAVESLYVGASMALIGGANLGSVIKADPMVMLSKVDVAKGISRVEGLTKYQKKLNEILLPRTVTAISRSVLSPDVNLSGFNETVMGKCAPNSTLKSCVGASGVIPRVDQYQEQNLVNFVRDNQGSLLRAEPVKPPTP